RERRDQQPLKDGPDGPDAVDETRRHRSRAGTAGVLGRGAAQDRVGTEEHDADEGEEDNVHDFARATPKRISDAGEHEADEPDERDARATETRIAIGKDADGDDADEAAGVERGRDAR